METAPPKAKFGVFVPKPGVVNFKESEEPKTGVVDWAGAEVPKVNVLLDGDLSLTVLRAPKTGAGDLNDRFCSELFIEPNVTFLLLSFSSPPGLLRLIPPEPVEFALNVKLKVPLVDAGAEVVAVKPEIPVPNEV